MTKFFFLPQATVLLINIIFLVFSVKVTGFRKEANNSDDAKLKTDTRILGKKTGIGKKQSLII